MTAATATRSRNGAGRQVVLPPVTGARFVEAARLLERLADQQSDRFLDRMQDYRDKHVEATRRPLNADEAAQIAAAMAAVDDKRKPEAIAAGLQKSSLYAYDRPSSSELLMAAGLSTLPAFFETAVRFAALIEMDPGVFEDARETSTLDDALDDAVIELQRLDLLVLRQRGTDALAHLADQAGTTPGEAWALLTRNVWGALKEAVGQMNQQSDSTWSSLMGSPAPTAGPDGTSSTASGSRMP